MAKLYHETPEEYIQYLRDGIIAQNEFIKQMEDLFSKHRNEHEQNFNQPCQVCSSFDQVITTNNEVWGEMNQQYKQAIKGIYE